MSPTPDSTFDDPQQVIADLQRQLASRTAERDEALAREAAVAEVLQLINASPCNLAPVFDAILEKAHTLCGAAQGAMFLFDGEHLRAVATRGMPEAFNSRMRAGCRAADFPLTQALLAGEPFNHVVDAALLDHPVARAAVELADAHTVLAVALRKGDALLGQIVATRREIRPFTNEQIALLEHFAAHVVIAMENARLLTETREALEQQTATSEVLQVINSSPGDLQPVFDAMLEKALRLCEAPCGHFRTYDNNLLRLVASRGVPDAYAEFLRVPMRPHPNNPLGRMLRGERVIRNADVAHEELYRVGDDPMRRAFVELGGARSAAHVALVNDDTLLGSLSIYRQEVKPFTDKQIALLQNFAAQAVIAMENARLLGELRQRTGDLEESLEYQTATSDVLKVISRSTFDLNPVLENVIETAIRLCRAHMGSIFRLDQGVYRWAVGIGIDPAYREIEMRSPIVPGTGTLVGRTALEQCPVQVLDAMADPLYAIKDETRLTDARTMLGVPLLREGVPIGVIAMARDRVEPFSGKEVELVSTFADQAVIAIENVRLLTEQREALEQQTATAEVLGVINSSPGDLSPVFDAMLQKAMGLCEAKFGTLWTWDGECMHAAAVRGASAEYTAFLLNGPHPPSPIAHQPLLNGATVIHIDDLMTTEGYRSGSSLARAVVELGGVRTLLAVPLRKDAALLGVFSIYRDEVRPFTEKQIALLENFAAQAVIAIENARLLGELREALEQQTATAEILRVINASPGELQPVFEAILEKGHQLCGVTQGSLQLYDGEKFCAVAVHGLSGALADRLRQGYSPSPTYPVWRMLEGEPFIHTPDLAEIDDSLARSVVGLGGTRTLLWVALRREDKLFGLIAAARLEVRPFSEKEIALLQSFAAQAVIAMDNARLLGEIRQRQAELRVTFDNMGDGVAMFDAEHRLAAWNTNFEQILDLSGEFLTGRPRLADYVRYLATQGEYGAVDVEAEVRRLSELVGTQGSLERTRPDGRVIEVRYNPVPDGGFVLIYSDITERKRAEAEIRAARDAAEKALADLKTAQASLVHAEKMASLGQLTAGIAHEIKNPLNFVNNFAGLSVELLDELKEASAPAVASLGSEMRAEIDEIVDTLSSNLAKIGEHGRRADGIVTSMLAHSRGTTGERQHVDLNALVEEALNLAYHGARARDQEFNITMERQFDAGLAPIEIVPQDLTRVFLNLFGNGFYAARKRAREEGDGFRPVLKVATRELGDLIEIRVRDNGTGMTPEIRDKLFQPFFTTKPTGEGTGLGLSISWDIISQQHGGTIEVDSREGEFTEFTIRLPRTYQSAAEAAS